MPQISVEYSESLSSVFDRRGFASTFHPAASALIGSALPGFKTRFRTTGDEVIGEGGAGQAMVHAELAILPGRDDEIKSRLGELAVATLCDHIAGGTGLDIQVTVEVRDLATYHKRVLPPATDG
ncbi:isomerase [Kribbella turkmenica]|uniref:Isomerase n=1 Tax=Kribbella turkmenica TaxID=2530375 RepID=A0A4R4W723_9ACTN|nr:isomerase [Kribbella turkmenica]TDD14468.1 isomerase [Kribbella turkmenica]